MKTSTWVLLLFVGACSDADLYVQSGEDPLAPDRVSLTGQLCTDDTGGSKFPVKVLIMMDGSQDMFAADPNGERFVRPGGGVTDLIDRFQGQTHVQFGFVGVGSTSKPLPAGQPAKFYPPNDPQIVAALNGLQAPYGSQRDLVNAISQMESFITTDIAASTPGAILRTRYIVYMLLAGPPDPPIPLDQLAGQVQRVRDLVLSEGALDFRLTIGLLYFGERSIDLVPDSYNCYLPGAATDPLCGCSGSVHGDAGYCSVFCAVDSGQASDADAEEAHEIYDSLTFVGGGQLQEFACATNIALDVPIASDSVRLVKKDIVAFNVNVRLTPDGPIKDSDGDGLADIEEIRATPPTSPTHWDTDNDGLGDRLEFRSVPEQDPTDPTDRPIACLDPAVALELPDRDLDLLNDCEEGILSTSPSIPDTDGDGLPDLLEFLAGTVPTSADDRLLDYDGDGIPNAREVLDHTDPRGHDGGARAIYAYRNNVTQLGLQPVASLENPIELPGLTFRTAASTVAGGQSYLRWQPCAGTLEWSDARYNHAPPFVPIPEDIPEDGIYTLRAQTPNGEQVWAEAEIRLGLMPTCLEAPEVIAFPLISVSERNCYDVRISNIKLLETSAADGEKAGLNHILVFFTQAPEDRLSSPGLAKVAEVRVQFECTNPKDLSTCARAPAGMINLTDSQFISVVP